MLSRRTELRHVQLEACGDCINNETMETLSRGRQSRGSDPVGPQESGVLPNLQSALLETGQVGGNSILLRLCYRKLRRKTEPGRWANDPTTR